MTETDNQELKQQVLELAQRVRRLEQAVLRRSALSVEPPPPPIIKIPNPPQPVVRPRESWEERIGGTWLNRIGVVALIVGLAFFLKYAFDQHWINDYGQVSLGVLTGCVLLGLGDYFRGRGGLPRFGAALAGAGAAAFYVTIYACYSYYGFLGTHVTFILLSLLTGGAIALALSHDSQALAALAFLGGFLTPWLLRGGGGYAVLLSTNVLLNLAALALLFWKPWLKLSLLNGFASYGALATALIAIYTTKDLLGFVVFLSVYYLLFLAMVQTTGLRHQLGWISVLAITTSCNFIFSVILLHNEPATLALLLMGWAGVLAVLGLRQKQELVGLSKGFQLMALAYATLAVPIYFGGSWITLAWAFFSAILLYMGCRPGHRLLRHWGWAVMALVFLRVVFLDLPLVQTLSQYTLPWRERLPALLAATGLMFLWARALRGKGLPWEEGFRPWLPVGAHLLILAAVLKEIDLYCWWQHQAGNIAHGLSWANALGSYWVFFYGGMLLALGFGLAWQDHRRLGLALILLGAGRVLFLNLEIFTPLGQLQGYGFLWLRLVPALLAGGLALALREAYQRIKGDNWVKLAPILAVTANLVILALTLSEFNRFYYLGGQGGLDDWQVYRDTAWSVTTGFHGLGLVAFGLWRLSPLFRKLGVALLLITVAKIVLYDLMGVETIWRILGFIATGKILLLASYLYQRFMSAASEQGRHG